ncbi:MAG: glycosyltransferase family 9 protein, partial [Selenomonadaceae bacterium]|nr:glycosyltransferase family 9 protein [Selenomonadaceae bacterium]
WDSSNFSDLLMAWLSGARERIGYGMNPAMEWLGSLDAVAEARDTFLLTKNIISPRSAVSEAEKNFYVLETGGFKVEETHMELFFGEEDFLRARELLQSVPPNCKKVLLGIGSSGAGRQYPVGKYLVALKELAKKNLVFVIVGGQTELDDANFIEKNLPHGKILNLVGKTTLRETEAVVAQTDFYVGNDTGVMHMSAAAQIPCLVLYREAQDKEEHLPGIFSEFRRFPPWQTNSIILRPDSQLEECAKLPPVYGWCHYSESHCITQISPQEIVDGFEVLETLG